MSRLNTPEERAKRLELRKQYQREYQRQLRTGRNRDLYLEYHREKMREHRAKLREQREQSGEGSTTNEI